MTPLCRPAPWHRAVATTAPKDVKTGKAIYPEALLKVSACVAYPKESQGPIDAFALDPAVASVLTARFGRGVRLLESRQKNLQVRKTDFAPHFL
jgi:hypothetical protein